MVDDQKRDVELFTEAVKLPTEERIAFLDQVCAGDEDLRHRIEKLLRLHARVGDFMDAPPAGPITEVRTKLDAAEKPGDRIGRYKLLQQIGEGGCGVVFAAEQEEPVRRRVALKLIKPGMDTKSVIARFEAERQALALMDHPNIAHVFDAGATQSGRPYFVMELVEGVKITDYCDQHSLPMETRLELFVEVCDAIQHAHQKGIIHRDIKPSNILVATGPDPDSSGVPKVIDFGIAKAIGGQLLTDKTIFTAREMLIGTPAYMSPEQAALTSTDLDTRTDIYSLGVLLYELLTGTTPFDTRELLKAGFDEVRRVIREVEPVRPSTRLSTLVAADRAEVAMPFGPQAQKLIRELRGDLDWIVMQALEKDPGRRYATANALATDIRRYLSGETVVARPPSAIYKFRKVAARNKVLFSGVTLTFVFLVISLITTTRWLMIESGAREQLRQQREIARMDDSGFGLYFEGNFEDAVQHLTKSLSLRRRLPEGELATPILHHSFIVQILNMEKRVDKIRPFVDEFVDPALLTRPGYKMQFEAWSDDLIKHKLWNDAADLIEKMRKASPTNSYYYHRLGPLLVGASDFEGYRLFCREVVTQFSHTTNVFEAERMAKDCLVLPSAGLDLQPVAEMAEFAVTNGKGTWGYPYFQCCKAMAQYRLGNYEEAANLAQASAENLSPSSQAEAYSILAMARYKLGSEEGARRALTNCNRVVETKLLGPQQDLGDDWPDWILAHALQSEAKRLLEGL